MHPWKGCLVFVSFLFLSACGTADSKLETYYKVNKLLTEGKCSEAIALIDPIFNSKDSDNTGRLLRASAYGCKAGVDFFGNLTSLTSNTNAISAAQFWGFTAKTWPSYLTTDQKVESATIAMDTLHTVLKTSAAVSTANALFTGSNNPGSILATDREDDANLLMVFVSMALIGELNTRYGNPDALFNQTTNLPWTTANAATNTSSIGCAYGAALTNLFDAAEAVKNSISGSAATAFNSILALKPGLDAACNAGCVVCGGGVACNACPTTLKNRQSCTTLTTDVNSCASAGLATSVNASW